MNRRAKDIIQQALNKYAWPGGYPLYLITADYGTLCSKCVKDNIREIVGAVRTQSDAQWEPLQTEVNYEDPDLYCGHCCTRIESAYAEPDDE